MSFLRLSVQKVLWQLLILLLCYTAFRYLFFAFNKGFIPEVAEQQWGRILWGGLRFDLSAIAFTNCLWIVLTLVFPLDNNNRWLQVLKAFSFYFPNIVAILFEVSDWVYFNFNRKRATFEVFDLIFTKSDFVNLLPSYIVSFWYVPLIAILFIGLVVWSHRRLNAYYAERWRLFRSLNFPKSGWYLWLFKPLSVLLGVGLIVLAMRGGTQLKPINNRNAVEYVPAGQAALVLNTPFSIITSAESGRLKPLDLMPLDEAVRLVAPIKQYGKDTPMQRKNVVVIIWESLSARYTGLGSKSVTPFLDSLMAHSLVFSKAYANALRSNEGVPAIFSGIPALMEGTITNSLYANNDFTSLPMLLKEEGYSTAFIHGGNNGTMNLDTYAKNAGFNKYIGRTEYGTQDYDGAWGVWDEPFLQFAAKEMATLKQPFLTGIFTLSSHTPFRVPETYKASSVNATDAVAKSMNYTDFALRRFFDAVKNTEWYANTLFVIVADHGCPVAKSSYDVEGLGRYHIPLVFFEPSAESQSLVDTSLMQQIDLTPTILDYLGYGKPFFALGNSAFDKKAKRFMLSYLSGNYIYLTPEWMFRTNQTILTEAFEHNDRSKKPKNHMRALLKTHPDAVKENQHFLNAFLQVMHYSVINNQMTAGQFKP